MIGTALKYLRDELNRINLLVVNVEEDREPRRANPYYDHNQRINPDIPEAEGLLQAVLGHAAGRLGDDGTFLRQAFLQRPGLLSARPGAWVLQVKRRPVDLVLDGLPWSWSWIRLPWMDDLVQVVW